MTRRQFGIDASHIYTNKSCLGNLGKAKCIGLVTFMVIGKIAGFINFIDNLEAELYAISVVLSWPAWNKGAPKVWYYSH